MSALLEARGLFKAYGGRVLLDHASLVLERGASYTLTGDNGCGKTTLMRMLAGLEPGRVDDLHFDGRPLLLNPYPEALRHQIIYVHQHPYLFRSSIRDNIAYGLKARGLARHEWEPVVDEALDWAGVAHLNGVPSHRLSGGEKQRVALARARVLHPRLFLLDEPTANLDHEARAQVVDLIARLRARDVSLLIACHDLEIIGLPGMQRLELADGHISLVK